MASVEMGARVVEVIVPTIEGITFSLPHACSQTEASSELGS
jgi:hypothetical protein